MIPPTPRRQNHIYPNRLLLCVVVLLVCISTPNAKTTPTSNTVVPPAKTATDAGSAPATNEGEQASPTPFPLSVKDVRIPNGGTDREAALGEKIIVVVENLKEELNRQQDPKSNVPEAERLNLGKFVLFLDKIEMTKLYPVAVAPDAGELHFQLRRDSDSRDVWLNFLARPKSDTIPVEASVGPEGKTPLPSGKTFTLRLYYPKLLNATIALFVLVLLGFLVAAKKTTIIRDSGPPNPTSGPLARPYSLARAQVAWWFFIILGAFLFIGVVTWDIDTITTSSLVLLGIGTGTALGAAMVDANKRENSTGDLRTLKPQQAKLEGMIGELDAKIAEAVKKLEAGDDPGVTANLAALRTERSTKEAELEQVKVAVGDAASGLEKPVSEGLIMDLLTDVNGVAFHRFQIIVWTIVLGLFFVYSVWSNLTMPQFSDTLLAMMGISAGTYLGFKIPERQTDVRDTANDANTADATSTVATNAAGANGAGANAEAVNANA